MQRIGIVFPVCTKIQKKNHIVISKGSEDLFKAFCSIVRSINDSTGQLTVIFLEFHEFHVIALSGYRSIHNNHKILPVGEKLFNKFVVPLKIRAFGNTRCILHGRSCDSFRLIIYTHKHHGNIWKQLASVVYRIPEGRIIRNHNNIIGLGSINLISQITVKIGCIGGIKEVPGIHELIADIHVEITYARFKP